MNEKTFKDLVKSILDKGNHVDFTVNDPKEKGVIVNEWSMIDDDGVLIPQNYLGSQAVDIDEDIAWDIVAGLGLYYPIIQDGTTGDQLQ